MQMMNFRLSFSFCFAVFLNKPRVYNRERLIQLITKRPKGIPLVTVSNHYSCFDDPGLWGCLPLGIVCNTYKIRWSMAAHDICFTNKLHSLFFMFGFQFKASRARGRRICSAKYKLADQRGIYTADPGNGAGKLNYSN